MPQDFKYLDMRNMLKKMREAQKRIDEVEAPKLQNMAAQQQAQPVKQDRHVLDPARQAEEEDKLRNAFNNLNVTIEFEPFEIFEDAEGKKALFGGTIDGQIMFSYSVTPEEATSGVDIEYLEGFDPADPENEQIIELLKRYYNDFYREWRDELFYNQ